MSEAPQTLRPPLEDFSTTPTERASLMAKLRKHRSKIFYVILGQGGAAIGMACGIRLLTEVASPSSMGFFKLGAGIVSLLAGLFFRPFTQYLMRAYHDADAAGRGAAFLGYVGQIARKGALYSAGLVFVGLSISQLFTGGISLELIIPICILVYLQPFITIRNGILVTQNRQKSANITRTATQWGIPIMAALCVLGWQDSGSALLFGEVACVVLILIFYRRILKIPAVSHQPEESARWGYEWCNFVTPLAVVGIFAWVLSISDRYIIALLLSPHEAGRYAAASGLGSQPILMCTGVAAQVLYPFLFKAAARGEEVRERRLLGYMTVCTTLAAALVLGVIYAAGEFVVVTLLAAEYQAGALPILRWVAAGYGVLSIASAFEMHNYASKTTMSIAVSYGLAAITNVSLNLWWVPTQGGLGAARATFISLTVYMVALLYYKLKHTKRYYVDQKSH